VKNAKHTRKNTPAQNTRISRITARRWWISLFTGDWYGAISGYAVSGEYLNTDGFLKKIKVASPFDLTDEESLFRTVKQRAVHRSA
jgi:hypothetical protein